MSRLTIDMAAEPFQCLRARVALAGRTIEPYALARRFSLDERAWQGLKSILPGCVDEAPAGRVSAKDVRGIFGDEPAEGGRD